MDKQKLTIEHLDEVGNKIYLGDEVYYDNRVQIITYIDENSIKLTCKKHGEKSKYGTLDPDVVLRINDKQLNARIKELEVKLSEACMIVGEFTAEMSELDITEDSDIWGSACDFLKQTSTFKLGAEPGDNKRHDKVITYFDMSTSTVTHMNSIEANSKSNLVVCKEVTASTDPVIHDFMNSSAYEPTDCMFKSMSLLHMGYLFDIHGKVYKKII